MADYFSLDFEAQIQREDPEAWEVVAIMRLNLGRAEYGQGAIDALQAMLEAWQRHDVGITKVRVLPQFVTALVEPV